MSLCFLASVNLNSEKSENEDGGAKVRVFDIKKGNNITIFGSNPLPTPMQVVLQTTHSNMTVSPETPVTAILAPNEENRVILEAKQEKSGHSSFRYSARVFWGDPSRKAARDYAYLLPFEPGLKVRAGRGKAHVGDKVHAIDFGVPIGTPVCAARSGTVVLVRDDSDKQGTDPSYAKYANVIIIAHEDGTYGSYVHLQKGGALVKPGDKVIAGKVIGRSGHTGYSFNPHLHFEISESVESRPLRAIPILFQIGPDEIGPLKNGSQYESFRAN